MKGLREGDSLEVKKIKYNWKTGHSEEIWLKAVYLKDDGWGNINVVLENGSIHMVRPGFWRKLSDMTGYYNYEEFLVVADEISRGIAPQVTGRRLTRLQYRILDRLAECNQMMSETPIKEKWAGFREIVLKTRLEN